MIIAEAGVNHNGSLVMARKLIDIAAEAKVDYIKFQTFKAELNVSKTAIKAIYQKVNTLTDNETQLELVKKLELKFEDFKKLYEYCLTKKVGFLSTGFDLPSLDFLDDIGQEFFKIPSGEITNKPYLQYIARKGKPVIMSTGMATMAEINAAFEILIEQGLSKEQITVLHCNSGYPTPMLDVNLKAMLTIKRELGVDIGYSDHTVGIEIPIAAVALGATIIEKHFTIDRNLPGPDHKSSLEPEELKSMVSAIRNVEIAMGGSGLKNPMPSELSNIIAARKSIHTAKPIKEGEVITLDHLIMKRPGDGISPMEVESIIGRVCMVNIDSDSKLTWDCIKKQ